MSAALLRINGISSRQRREAESIVYSDAKDFSATWSLDGSFDVLERTSYRLVRCIGGAVTLMSRLFQWVVHSASLPVMGAKCIRGPKVPIYHHQNLFQ